MGFVACSTPKNEKKTDLKTKVQAEKQSKTLPAYKRVVVIGDELLELVCALGDSLKVVAVGKPHSKVAHRKLPAVGYKGSLQVALVQKAKPDAVVCEEDMIDDKTQEAIEELGIPCYRLPKLQKPEEMPQFFKELGRLLKQEKKAQLWNDSLAYHTARIAQICKKKRKDTLRVMYVQARTANALLLNGANTLPDLMLRLAGVSNAGAEFEGFEPLKVETMQTINPDFIIISKRTLNSLQGRPQDVPQFTSSQAYRMGRVLVLEDTDLLGVPFRTGKTSLYICQKLYQENYYSALPVLRDVPLPERDGKETTMPETPRRDKVEEVTPTPINPNKNEPTLEDLKGGG